MYFLLPMVALGASLLTFFSGFGLGTILSPVFALFFSIELAIVMTAIVHLLNGLFKLWLVGREAKLAVVLRFGLPAMVAALAGAWLLSQLAEIPPIASYHMGSREFFVTPIKLISALLMIGFTLIEIIPLLKNLEFHPRFLSLGGILSGFFGGLSGHQGALRSAFLARAGLTKEQFVGTGTAIGAMIDLARISVYAKHLSSQGITSNLSLIVITTLAAFLGAFLGNKLLKKMTMRGVQSVVSASLLILALALGSGLI